MATIHKVDIAGQAGGWFDETSTASGWFYRELEDQAGPADDTPGNACMSLDVCVEGYAQTVEYYATEEVQGEQRAPLHDFTLPPDESVLNTSIPDYLPDEMFEPGVFWFQTGPPTSLDDETGQTRGQTCLPDYLEPDDQIDPSDADWQNPTTQNDATCTSPTIIGNATGGNATSTSHTINLPVASVGGAYLALVTWDSTGVVPTFPAGWSVVTFWTSTALTQNFSSAVLWRVVDGTEGAAATVTTVGPLDSSIICYAIASADPFTAPVFVNDLTSGNGQNPVSITIPWADPSLVFGVMWQQIDEGELTYPANLPAGRLYHETSNATGAVQSAAAQTSASSFDPSAFSAPAGSTTVSTIAVRGYCANNLNTDPAGCSVPADLEPEAEVDCYGWQSQGPVDDPNVVIDDPDTGRTSVPDWLEPDAEPNPDDVTFGWQRQSLVEEDYETGAQWTAVTEPQEDVFEESPEWVKTPTFEFAGDDDPAPHYFPDDMDLEDEPLQDGWQQSVTIEDIPLNEDIPLTSIPTDLEPEAEVDSDGWQHPASDDGPVCTFPAVVSVTAGNNLTTSTSHVITLPTLSIGDLAVVVFGDNGNTHTATAGWTEEVDNESVAVYSRVIDGSEGASMTITSSASTESVWYVYRIAAGSFDPLQTIFKSTTLNSATQDPPNVVFGWTDKTLVLAAMAGDTATSPITFTSGPSNLTAGFVGQETGGIALPDAYLAVAWGFADASSFDPNAFSITGQSSNYDLATIAIRGTCPLDLTTPGGHEFPADLEPEAEALQDGWTGGPLHDIPQNDDIVGRSVPDDLEPEPEPDANGWQSEPLHDTPSTTDITDTSVPVELLPEDQVDADGWAFRLPDMERFIEPPPDPGVSVGTLPGHVARRKWWVERVSKTEKAKRERGEGRWPNLPEPKNVPYFKPKVVTNHTVRPRLEQINRDWKIKMRKVRDADDAIIAAIIASILSEGTNDNDS